MSQLEAQIEKLKKQQNWDALANLYEDAIQQTQNLEQKLFFMWELAQVLSVELGEAGGALLVLNDAISLGAPLDMILPQMEVIRTSYLMDIQAIDLYEKRLNEILKIGLTPQTQDHIILIATALYQAYLSQNRLEEANYLQQQLGIVIQDKPAQFEAAHQELIPSEHTLPAAPPEDYQAFLNLEKAYQKTTASQDLLHTPVSIEHGFQEVIQSQDTGVPEINFKLKETLQRLQNQGHSPANADIFLNDFEYLCSLGPLSKDLQLHLEAPLWNAAQKGSISGWRRWAKLYENAFAANSESIEMLVQRNLRLAAVYEEKLEELGIAIKKYELILSYIPTHQEAYLRLKGIYSTQKAWELLVNLMKSYVQVLTDRKLKFEIYLELGDIYRDHVKSPSKAVATWFLALEIMADSRQILVRLLEIYQQTEKWPAAVKVLKKLIKLEPNPHKKAHYVYAIGLIQRDQLNDHYMAVRTFDETLECDPTFMKAFYALSEILINDKDFARQDRYFRKMLIRAIEHKQDAAIIVEIAKQIGALNVEKLNDLLSAKQAYELILNYKADDLEAHEKLVHLKKKLEGPKSAAEQAYQWARKAPYQMKAYQKLYELSVEADLLDWAWCVANVLQHQRQPVLDSAQLVVEGQKRMNSRLQSPLDLQDWRLLIWAGKRDLIDQLSALSNAVNMELFAQKPKKYQINLKKDKLQLSQSGTFGRVVEYLCNTLGIAVPSIWVGQVKAGLNFEIVNFEEIGIVVSPQFVQNKNIEELACQLSYALYLSQPQFWLASMNGEDGNAMMRMDLLLQASLQAFVTTIQAPKSDIGEIAQLLLKLPADIKTDCKNLMLHIQQDRDELNKWLRAVEQTAYRLSLLLCNHLGNVVELMKQQPSLSGESIEERVSKLYLFSISTPYLELRQKLGTGLRI